jgi:hypothetical protein
MRINAQAPKNDGSRDYVQSLRGQYPGSIITQSYLRSETTLGTTATSQFAFNILANQGTPNSTERRLQITDRFAVTAVSVMLYQYDNSSASTAAANRSQAKLYTWNAPARFTTATAAIAITEYDIADGSFHNKYTETEVGTKAPPTLIAIRVVASPYSTLGIR